MLRKDVDKITKENEILKKENEVIREGNDYIGVFSQEMIDKFKKLSDDMTSNITAATPLVKKYNHNIFFMKSVQALIRFNQQLEEILKKIYKKLSSQSHRDCDLAASMTLHTYLFSIALVKMSEPIAFALALATAALSASVPLLTLFPYISAEVEN